MCKVFPFHNSLGLTCLHARYVCDGIQHCEQGEDELPSECGGKGGHGGKTDSNDAILYRNHRPNEKTMFAYFKTTFIKPCELWNIFTIYTREMVSKHY